MPGRFSEFALVGTPAGGAVHGVEGARGAPGVPGWVEELFQEGGRERRGVRLGSGGAVCEAEVREGDGATLVGITLRGADGLSVAGLRAATAEMYAWVRSALAGTGAPHAVRMWNFIPAINQRIHERARDGTEGALDRYRAFNLGRFDAFERWFGESSAFDRALPTATGVGHGGDELVVYALGAAAEGAPVENPRQRPAFRYSRRYGPRPPCFARSTRATIRGEEVLLIGGTASVRDERSVHEGSVSAQIDESVENLASLLRRVCDDPAPLRRITEARVYYVRPRDAAAVETAVMVRLPGARRVEMVRAEICREELLVEIEAVAALSARGEGEAQG